MGAPDTIEKLTTATSCPRGCRDAALSSPSSCANLTEMKLGSRAGNTRLHQISSPCRAPLRAAEGERSRAASSNSGAKGSRRFILYCMEEGAYP